MKSSKLLLSFIITITLFANCSKDQAPEATISKKIIKTEEKWFQPGDMMDTLLFGFRAEYDKKGDPVDKKSFSRADGSLNFHTTYKYDDHGNAIEEINTQSQNNIVNTYLSEYQYDKSGKILKMLRTDVSKNIQTEHLYTYRKDGSYDEAVKNQSQDDSFKSYDANGNIILLKRFVNNSVIKNDYDEQGNLLKKVMTVSDKIVQNSEYVNEYDEEGRLSSTEMGYRKRVYEYNENGDVLKESWYKNDMLDRIIHYRYTYYE